MELLNVPIGMKWQNPSQRKIKKEHHCISGSSLGATRAVSSDCDAWNNGWNLIFPPLFLLGECECAAVAGQYNHTVSSPSAGQEMRLRAAWRTQTSNSFHGSAKPSEREVASGCDGVILSQQRGREGGGWRGGERAQVGQVSQGPREGNTHQGLMWQTRWGGFHRCCSYR